MSFIEVCDIGECSENERTGSIMILSPKAIEKAYNDELINEFVRKHGHKAPMDKKIHTCKSCWNNVLNEDKHGDEYEYVCVDSFTSIIGGFVIFLKDEDWNTIIDNWEEA